MCSPENAVQIPLLLISIHSKKGKHFHLSSLPFDLPIKPILVYYTSSTK
jgi:hypothetical protein